MQTEINETLQLFKSKLNANEKVKNLLTNWSPNIIISSDDEDFTLLVRNMEIDEIKKGKHESDHTISVIADKDILIEVFSGISNPSKIVLEGEMAVYGKEADQIKLDAISMFIWGA